MTEREAMLMLIGKLVVAQGDMGGALAILAEHEAGIAAAARASALEEAAQIAEAFASERMAQMERRPSVATTIDDVLIAALRGKHSEALRLRDALRALAAQAGNEPTR